MTEAHADLLSRRPGAAGQTLDAIIVSAFRPAENLLTAMRLAAETDLRLVLVCSGAAGPAAVRRLAASIDRLRYAVLPLPHAWAGDSLNHRSDRYAGGAGGLGDLSTKRNLGLVLAHLLAWRSILFLDDDIRDLTPALLDRAVAALPPGGAVGMPAYEFPDNSVVCHANRRTGYQQDVFVSGSALVVNCTETTPFFPRIYNEDWLFLAPTVARGAVTAMGSTRQLAYEPFADPGLAAAQEFGNVVADGLMTLLHHGDMATASRAVYWKEFLSRRREFIAGIAGRTRSDDHTVLAAVAAAECRRAQITTDELAGWVADWRHDLDTWPARLERLPRHLTLANALVRLGLSKGTVVSADFDRPPRRRDEQDTPLSGIA